MNQPTCSIIAGVNGAGKTTFASKMYAKSKTRFINVDLIAEGLDPLAPSEKAMSAGRLLLKEINSCIEENLDFAFETTLSGRSYLRLVKHLLKKDWTIKLYYLWLPNKKLSELRVKKRASFGGHSVPINAIKRRYSKSIINFRDEFLPLCSIVYCIDNSTEKPSIIFVKTDEFLDIKNEEIYKKIKGVSHDQ